MQFLGSRGVDETSKENGSTFLEPQIPDVFLLRAIQGFLQPTQNHLTLHFILLKTLAPLLCEGLWLQIKRLSGSLNQTDEHFDEHSK